MNTIALILGYALFVISTVIILLLLINPFIDLLTDNIKRLRLFYAYVIEHEEINKILQEGTKYKK